MIQALLRHGLGVAILFGLLTAVMAQEAKDKPAKGKDAPAKDVAPPPPTDPFDSYRELFKKPETVADYWKALEFEIELGSFDVAAQDLRGLLAKKPTDEQLLELQRQVTMNAFLRLRNIPKWSKDPAADKAARADVEELIKLVTAAVKNQLNNRDQIREWVKNLNASHEEAVYALQELYKYKAAAAPVLIEELKKTQGGDRVALIDALRRLSSAVVPPIVAALDSNDNSLVLDLLDILQKRGATEAVPFLWYLTEAPDRPPSVQKKAKAVIATLRDTPVLQLPTAEPMLVQEAERYFQHKVPMAEPVTVWRWDGNTVVPGWPGAETVSKSKAEEYYALRFAKQALELQPTDQAAQIAMLSTTLEKTYESVPLDKPLAVTAPAVNDLLTRVNPELLTAVLERAIKDENTTIVLGAVRALGDLAEARANKPLERGLAPLGEALYYPDRRVQLAAVDSLLYVPGTPSALARGRMVEILARFLAAEPAGTGFKPKALAASGDPDGRLRLERALQDAGFEPVLVADGRAALKRLDGSADISAILLDSKLPNPGLPYFIAQVESDPNLKKLPVLILAVPDSVEARDLLDRYSKEQTRLDYLISKSQQFRQDRKAAQSKYMASRKVYLDNPVSNIHEQSDRLALLDDNYQASLREIERRLPVEAIHDKEAQTIERKLKELAQSYDGETSRREAALKRWAEPYANVQIVTQKYLDDIRQLRSRLLGGGKAESKPLSEAEQREYAEKAVRLLGQMAKTTAKGYDIHSAEKPVLSALRAGTISPEGQLVAISTIGTFQGAEPQSELAAVILDAKRPLPVRIAAADELIHHIQEHTALMTFAEIKALRSLADESTTQAGLKDLRPHLSALQGSLRPDENVTGMRLRAFPFPAPVPTAKPADKPAEEKPPAEKPPADKPVDDKPPADKPMPDKAP